MTSSVPNKEELIVRPLQYRDVDAINALVSECVARETSKRLITVDRELEQVGSWYGLKRFLSLLPAGAVFDFPMMVKRQIVWLPNASFKIILTS